MNKELPVLWALDKAAKLSGWASWADAAKHASENEKTAVIAHALTLGKYEQPPEDPDKLAVREILAAGYGIITYRTKDQTDTCPYFRAALAAYKREKAK